MIEELEKALKENEVAMKSETNLGRLVDLMAARTEILKSLVALYKAERKVAA